MYANYTRRIPRLFFSVVFIVILTFIYLPIFVLVLFSFQDGNLPVPPFSGFSMRWYEQMLGNGRLLNSLANSVLVGVLSAATSTVLGFLAAYGLARYRLFLAGVIQWYLLAPLLVSYVIIGLGLLITFNAIGISMSLWTVFLGHVVINLPLAFAIIFSQMGEHLVNIERAARDLGANDLQVVVLIVVPILWPTMFAAFCIALTFSWDEFIVAFLLSRFSVTLPVEIWAMLRRGLNPETNAVGSFVFMISATSVGIATAVVLLRVRR